LKALIITYEKYQDHEVIYPYYRLLEETENVSVASNKEGSVTGILGCSVKSDILISEFHRAEAYVAMLNDFDFLVLPGGVKAMEKLRQEKMVIKFVADWNEKNKVIACTCSGAQLLISAKIVKGRKISAYYSMEDDIINAGAFYSPDPVVRDGNIITSPHYDFMSKWLREAIDVYRQEKNG
jgi:protease I